MKNIQRELDQIDLQILTQLTRDGRVSNAELAERVGIAPSTCLGRVRSLVADRVITGFAAEVSPAAIGLGLEALISVTLRAGARASLATFMTEMRQRQQVVQVFFLGGSEDFIVHVAMRDSDDLREFVLEHLSNNPTVANTRTNVVFDHFHKGPNPNSLP